jgi:superkiller protein 3
MKTTQPKHAHPFSPFGGRGAAKFFLILFVALVTTATLQAQKKTFVRDYAYQASEDDSRNTARTNATSQMRNILLREIGEFLHAERTTTTQGNVQEYLEKIEAITAGIIEMKVLDEQWDGATFYIKAEMTVDPAEVNKRIAEVFNDKQKTKELEESRRRTLEAEAEIAKTKKELENTRRAIASAEAEKDKLKKELAVQKNQALQATYVQQVEKFSADEYVTRGYNANENGLYELAIENYQKALAINPNYAMAYNNMGNTYRNLENYNEAIRCFQKAIAIDPNFAWAYNNMGIVYDKLKNYNEAIRRYQKAIDINPNYAKVYYNMGIAYDDLGNYNEAIQRYQTAIAIDPKYAKAYNNMGSVYKALGNYKEAIRCWQKAAQLGHSGCQEFLRENGYSW